MYLDPQAKTKITRHAVRLAGQVKSIKTMLTENRNAHDILLVLLAVQGSIATLTSHLDSAFRMELNILLHTPHPEKLQDSEYLQFIESLKLLLQKCTSEELFKIM